jgi:hypothetical protein
VRNIKNVSAVSAVMEHTGHVMPSAKAQKICCRHGFPRENLLTDRSRKIWLLWKEYHSTDDWCTGIADLQCAVAITYIRLQAELWGSYPHRLEQRAAQLGIERNSVWCYPARLVPLTDHSLLRAQRQG